MRVLLSSLRWAGPGLQAVPHDCGRCTHDAKIAKEEEEGKGSWRGGRRASLYIGVWSKAESGRKAAQAALDDSVFGQVAELHVSESLPWADHCEVCKREGDPHQYWCNVA